MLTMDSQTYIHLKKLRFRAFHGVMPQERKVGGYFLLTLRIGFPWQRAMVSDEVADTLNYAEVYEVVKREMDVPSDLLEHVGGRIANSLFQAFPQILSVDLWLTKECPPMGADGTGAGIELHLINNKTG